MVKKNSRRSTAQSKPKPPSGPEPKFSPENNPFAALAGPQPRENGRPPRRSGGAPPPPPPPRAPVGPRASPAPQASIPPLTNGDSTHTPAPAPAVTVDDPRVAESRALLEKGLVAQAFAALSPRDKPAPSPARLARIERLSGCVSRFHTALRAREYDAALREWDGARDAWLERDKAKGAESGAPQPGVPWEGKVWRCEALEGAKRWSELESYSTTVLKNKVPDRPRMQLFRAVALYQQGKLDGASKGLNEIKHADVETTQKADALSSRVQRLMALKDSGNAAFAEGGYEEAIADYSHALLVDPENVQLRSILYNNRGMAKLRLGKDVHAAIADLTSAVTLSPRSVKALKHRAQAYVRLGRLDLALQDLERAVEASNEGGERRALERERDEDHYKILGIDRNASTVEIKKAYRSMSLKHHPDKGGDQATFVKSSYEILSDERRRRLYDEGESDDPSASSSPFFRPGHSQSHGGGGGGAVDSDSDDAEAYGVPPWAFFEFLFGQAHARAAGGGRGGRGGRGGGRGGRR
ncbi:hypothetical protein DMC30DRAFT_429348 [Rhodotorula diobovata]|uniref:J domain-containing protein n=1 Tax=Rhodotorula diobovata TaxID=5288 RepID=A0A5C5FPI8_9BASI|nr:hypothetical protein DMC30DRAFT_429348 [Rhodotorula diobovata]